MHRNLAMLTNLRLFGFSLKTRWSSSINLKEELIREAEKIVDYRSSCLNSGWLQSDDFANMVVSLQKLQIPNNHQIIQAAKHLIHNVNNPHQSWSLIMLLLAKSLKTNSDSNAFSPGQVVYERQKEFAELTEIIRTGHLVHAGVISLPMTIINNITQLQISGNKLSILIGDHFLATGYNMLARLKNQDLSYLISTALRDLSDGAFFGPRDLNDNALPGKGNETVIDDKYEIQIDNTPIGTENVLGMPIREWTVRSLFSGATLLGRGCQGIAILAKDSEESQGNAFLFGCNLNLAWQANDEFQQISNDSVNNFSLVSAPVLFAIDQNPDLYDLIATKVGEEPDYDKIRTEVLSTDALRKTHSLIIEHSKKAEKYVDLIGNNESVNVIKKMIRTAYNQKS